MAGSTTEHTAHARRVRPGIRERRRHTPENLAVRRTIDVLGWAAELAPEREDERRAALLNAREGAIAALRRDSSGRLISMLEMRVATLPAVILVAVFLLGLGLGLSFGGTSG